MFRTVPLPLVIQKGVIMKQEPFSDLVEKLANDCVSQSIGSIDYGLNAKAIALMNPDVKKRIIEQLESGFRLVEIAPLSGFGSSLMNFKVLFQFEPTDSDPKTRPPIDLKSRSFVVSVELPTKAVLGIADDAPTAVPQSFDVPFSVAFPNLNASRPVPMSETAAARDRQAAYFRSLGIGQGSRGGVVDPSPIDDPWRPGGGGFTPPRGGPVIIIPGGSPFGGGTTTYDTTPTYTNSKTTIDSPTQTAVGSESFSNNVADDSTTDYITDVESDAITDGQVWDGDTGDNPHPDRGASTMYDRPFR
jgi:hypothetical protein